MRLNVKGLPNECRETAFACRLDLKEIGLDRGDSPWAPEQRRESKHEPAPPCHCDDGREIAGAFASSLGFLD
jgi:hypothetical protein